MSFKRIKLRYLDIDTPVLQFTQDVTTLVYNRYYINDPYDVNAAIGSTTMPGFTEWSTVYNQYMATYVKVTATFSGDVGNPPAYAGIVFRPLYNETNWSTWANWMKLKGNPIPHKRVLLSESGGSRSTVTLTVKCPLWRLFGNKPEFYGSGRFSNPVTSSPSHKIEGFVYMLTPGGQPFPATHSWAVQTEVTMWIKMFNKKTLES